MKSNENKSAWIIVFLAAAFLVISTLSLTGVSESQREEASLTRFLTKETRTGEQSGAGEKAAAGKEQALSGQSAGEAGQENRGTGSGTGAAAGSDHADRSGSGNAGTSGGGAGAGLPGNSAPAFRAIPESQRIVAGNGTGGSSGTGGTADPGMEVTEVRLTGTTTQMLQAETLQLVPTILPESAAGAPLTWKSSDEVIAKVTQSGLVTSLRGGDVVISASAPNGITCEYPITVSPTQAHMILQITTEYPADDTALNDWIFTCRINGEEVKGGEEYIVTLGDVYSFVTSAVTRDGTRSTGDVEGSFFIDDSGVEGGFESSQEFIVEDTRPDHRGDSTSFTVTYRFSRAVE